MRNLLYSFVVILLMQGCSYKNEPLALHAYKADYAGAVSKDKKSVYLSLVKDTREDKRTIGVRLKNDENVDRFYSDTNFAQKYKSGLVHALNIAEFNTDVTEDTASLVVEVYIKKIYISHNDKKIDKNLQGELEIEVVIRRGKEVITQNFRQSSERWIMPSYNSKKIEPFLYELFSDSINDIVSRLTRY